VRAQDRDNAYRDDRSITYADQAVAATGDAYRRLVVMKTIQLRNAGA
jgi:hypothetical protein